MLLLEQFENLTLHPKNAGRLKALVLQLAVQGKLTENWRNQNPNVEPATALLTLIGAEKVRLVKDKKIRLEKPLEPISEDELPYTLPEGWTWCRLGEIANLINGDRGKNYPSKEHYVTEGIPFISAGNLLNNKLDYQNLNYITEERYDFLNSGKVQDKDILYCLRGSLGKTAIVKNIDSGAIASSLVILRLHMPFLHKYLLHFLTSPVGLIQIKRFDNGSAQPNLSANNVKRYIIAIPPLVEQEAIVARVEELMQKIEELEKHTAERIQLKQHLGAAALQQLTAATDEELEQNWLFLKQHFQTVFDEAANVKKLRETILQLAVQGKLTATWRTQNPTTEPASELLKRIQAEKAQLVKEKKIRKEKPLEPISADEVPYTLPEGWVWCKLGDIATSFNNGLYKPAKFYTDQGVISLRMYNIQEGSISFHDLRRVELSPEELDIYVLEENDILLNRVNSAELIGKAALIPKYKEGLVYESMNIRIKLIFKNHVAKYSNLLLRTSFARDYMRANAKHAIGQSSVNQTTVSNLLYPLPPLTEQEAIVAKVDQLMQLCDELEQQIQQSKQEAEALMQAVVQEALQVQEEVAL